MWRRACSSATASEKAAKSHADLEASSSVSPELRSCSGSSSLQGNVLNEDILEHDEVVDMVEDMMKVVEGMQPVDMLTDLGVVGMDREGMLMGLEDMDKVN